MNLPFRLANDIRGGRLSQYSADPDTRTTEELQSPEKESLRLTDCVEKVPLKLESSELSQERSSW
jgi:hypothetical protein